MTRLRILFILFSLLFFTNFQSSAQSRLGIYVGGGTTWYYGDMNDRIFAHKKLFRYYVNGGLLYRINSRFDVLANFTFGKIAGADSLAIQDFNLKRNLNFESSISEISLLVNYKFLRNNGSTRRLNPYFIAGVGFLNFNPKADFNGEKIKLQPLGTEGQYINGDGYPKPYKLYTLSIPLGIGVEVPLTRTLAVRVEYASHFTMTDYLDDVSSKYADSTKLAATPNGAQAVALASKLVKGYPNEGYGRGNSKQKDTFSTLGITILYMPGSIGSGGNGKGKGVFGTKKRKRNGACPAFN